MKDLKIKAIASLVAVCTLGGAWCALSTERNVVADAEQAPSQQAPSEPTSAAVAVGAEPAPALPEPVAQPLRWFEADTPAPAHYAPAFGLQAADGLCVDVRPESGSATVFEVDLDLDLDGLVLRRTRSSGQLAAGRFGRGWVSDLDTRLSRLAGAIAVRRVQGLSLFTPLQQGVYVSVWGDVELLRRTDAGYELITASGRTFEFDSSGQLTALSPEFSVQRTPGRIQLLGARGAVRFELDSAGRVTRIEAPRSTLDYRYEGAELASVRGQKVRDYTVEANCLSRIEGAEGRLLELAYDPRGRVARLDAEGWSQGYRYGRKGEHSLASVETPEGRWVYRLLANGWDVDSPQGVQRVRFDARGRLIDEPGLASRDPWERALPAGSVERRYDAAGRLSELVGPGARESLGWNAAGLLARRSSIDGRESRYTYTAGRLTSAADAAGVTAYAYGSHGRLREVTTPAGVAWTFGYADGALVRQDGPMGYVTQTWTGERLVRRGDASGRVLDYRYDSAGRPLEIKSADGERARFSYDAHGGLKSWSGAAGSTRVQDSAGTRTVTTGSVSVTTAFRETRDTVNSPFGTVQRTRDAAGRIARIESPAGAFAFDYDAHGQRAQLRYPNGVVLSTVRDALGRATLQRATHGTHTRHELATHWNARHEVARQETQGSAATYTYDDVGRLHTVRTTEGTRSFSYDADGNRTRHVDARGTRSSSYDSRGRLQARGAERFAYDASGRLIERIAGEAHDRFGYDGFGRLAWVERADSARVDYGYDALGRIVTRRIDDAQQRFVYDDERLLAVLGPGSEERVFVYGPDLDEPLAYRDDDDAGWTYLVSSELHTSLGYLDDQGEVVGRVALGAFGEVLEADLQRPLFFAGRLYDPVARIYPMRARAYDPELGRFLTPDPSGLAGGTNAYVYARNRPLDRVDPLGLWDWVPTWAQRDVATVDSAPVDVAASSQRFLSHATGFAAYLWEDVKAGRARDRIYGAIDAYSSFVTFGLAGTDLSAIADSVEEARRGAVWGNRAGWGFAIVTARPLIVGAVKAVPRLPALVVNGARSARSSAPSWIPRARAALSQAPAATVRGLEWVNANRGPLAASLLVFLKGQAAGVWNVTGRPFVSAGEAGVELLNGVANSARQVLPSGKAAQASNGGGQVAAAKATPPETPGIVGRLEGRTGGKPGSGARSHAHEPPGAPAGYRSVHPQPPTWLQQRMDATVAAVRRGESGPEAKPEDVAHFVRETFEHVNEVGALTRALGAGARPIPTAERAGAALRGIHDFGERASLRRVKDFLEQAKASPLTDRSGQAVPVPRWLETLVADAEAAGEATIDVGKLSPHVAAGLGRAGPPDLYAIRLHNLSAHHTRTWSANAGPESKAVVEAVADMVSAMRQPRSYRNPPMPMSMDAIREQLGRSIANGDLPPGSEALVERALAAQARLERTPGSGVNPYYRWEEAAESAAAEAAAAEAGSGVVVEEVSLSSLSAKDAKAIRDLERAAEERQLAALEVDDGLGVINNGSGESAASIEAINRARQNRFLVVDGQGKVVRELIGPDAVDYNASRYLEPGQAFVLQNRTTGTVTVYDTKGLSAERVRTQGVANEPELVIPDGY